MADNVSTAGQVLGFLGNVIPPAVSAYSSHRQQQDLYNAAMENQRRQRMEESGFGKISPAQQYLTTLQMQRQLAPEQELQLTQHPTLTPFQNFMSNASLVGAIPGQLQQIAPGLLPAIGRAGAGGKFIQNLFSPDTSYLDELNRVQQEQFINETVPQLRAMYGPGNEQMATSAIRAAANDLARANIERKAGAYERGLERQLGASHQLMQQGMQPRFQYGYEPKAQQRDVLKEAQVVTDPKTGKQIPVEERISQLERVAPKIGKQFRAQYDKADQAGKFAMQNAIAANEKGPMPLLWSKFQSPQQYQQWAAVRQIPDEKVQKTLRYMNMNSTPDQFKRFFDALAEDTPNNKKIVEHYMRKAGVAKPKHSRGYASVLKGAALPVAAGLGLIGGAAAGVPGALASGASSLLSFLTGSKGK